jgi:non-ribosomal peptide synthetase component E (peptide arylation enzyme)
MTAAEQSSLSEVTSQPGTTSHVSLSGGTEGISHQIIGHKLNEYNYLQWSSSVMMLFVERAEMTISQGISSYQKKMIPCSEHGRLKIIW